MRVLGVDPGLTRCGVGVVDVEGGRRVSLVAVGVIRSPAGDPPERRLLAVAAGLDGWLSEHRPDAVAVERVFAQLNVRTVTGTAQVAGLAMLAAARHDLPVGLHTPSEVKAAVTGSGRAGKEQVQRMVARILALAEVPRPADAADALALAICHAWRPPAPTPTARADLTPAQLRWARAAEAARRPG